METPLDSLLAQFIADSVRIAQTMAVDALRLGLDALPVAPRPRPPTSATRGQRRTPRALAAPVAVAAISERIVSGLRAAPGQTIGELAAAVRQATDELKPIIKRLVVTKQVRFQGQTRARRYFVAVPRASRKAAPTRAKRKSSVRRSRTPRRARAPKA